MQARYNLPAFRTIEFVLEHDYADCANVSVQDAYPVRSMLERMEFEQVVVPMSHAYEERFIRGTTEYLRGFHDAALALNVGTASLARDVLDAGFAVRRFDDELVVTACWADERVTPGDHIVAVNGFDVPAYARQAHGSLRDATGDPAHEVWDVALSFSRHFDVARASDAAGGSVAQRLRTRHVRPDEATATSKRMARGGAAVRELDGNVLWVRLAHAGKEAEAAEVMRLAGDASRLEGARGVILDVRGAGVGGRPIGDAVADALVPLLLSERAPLHELPGYGPVYLQCSLNNCRMVGDIVDAAAARAQDAGKAGNEAARMRALAAEVRDMAGAGLCLIDPYGIDPGEVVEPVAASVPVVLLTDIDTVGAAENLVRIARERGRGRVVTVGRPTMGTLDCTLPLTVALDHAYTLTYPAALDPRAHGTDRTRLNDVGFRPDVEVVWTPEHVVRDLDLECSLQLFA